MRSFVTHVLTLLSLTSVVKLQFTDTNKIFSRGQKELLELKDDQHLNQLDVHQYYNKGNGERLPIIDVIEGRSNEDDNWGDEDIDKKIKEEIEKSKKEIMQDVDEKISDALKEISERGLSDADKEWIDSQIQTETERIKESIRKSHEEIQSTIYKEVSGAKERIGQIQRRITLLDKQWKQELRHEMEIIKMNLQDDLNSKIKSLEDKQIQDKEETIKDLDKLQEQIQNTRNDIEKMSSDLTNEIDSKITQVKEDIEEQISQSVNETELETRIQRVLEEKLKSIQENPTPASSKNEDTGDSLLVWKIILGSLLTLNLLSLGYFFFIYRRIQSLKQKLKGSNGLRDEERPKRKFINNDLQVLYDKRLDETSFTSKKTLI